MLKAIQATYRILETAVESFHRAVPRSMKIVLGIAILLGFIVGPLISFIFLFTAWIIFLDVKTDQILDRIRKLEENK